MPLLIKNTLRLRVGNLGVIMPAAVCVAGRVSAGPRLNFLYKNCVRRIILLSLYLINKITFKTYKNEKGNHRPVV